MFAATLGRHMNKESNTQLKYSIITKLLRVKGDIFGGFYITPSSQYVRYNKTCTLCRVLHPIGQIPCLLRFVGA